MTRNLWFILAAAVFVLIGLGLALGIFSSGTPVRAERAFRGTIRQYIDEQARTRLPQTYLVTMPFAGRVEAVELIEGQHVDAGKVVAQIVPSDLKLDVEQAAAAVERLQASITESADVSVEETGLDQAKEFVKSTAAMLSATDELVRSSKAKSDYAESVYQRAVETFKKKATSQDDFDAATLQEKQSRYDHARDKFMRESVAAMNAATSLMPTLVRQYIVRKGLGTDVLKKQLAEARVRQQQVLRDRERGAMRSPVDGVVLNRFNTNERFLPGGASLLEIGRLEDLEIEAEILSLDVVAAKVGDDVEIYGPAVGQPGVKGKVARVYPAGFTKVSSLGVEQQRVMVVVRFDAKDLERLLDERRLGVGYRVRVRIITAEKSDALVVPRSALFRSTSGDWQVFVVRNRRARLQKVTIGLMNDELAEITDGLSDDEPVVLAPESTLSDGARVRVTTAEGGRRRAENGGQKVE
jgi:HlyD family secretion protein